MKKDKSTRLSVDGTLTVQHGGMQIQLIGTGQVLQFSILQDGQLTFGISFGVQNVSEFLSDPMTIARLAEGIASLRFSVFPPKHKCTKRAKKSAKVKP